MTSLACGQTIFSLPPVNYGYRILCDDDNRIPIMLIHGIALTMLFALYAAVTIKCNSEVFSTSLDDNYCLHPHHSDGSDNSENKMMYLSTNRRTVMAIRCSDFYE